MTSRSRVKIHLITTFCSTLMSCLYLTYVAEKNIITDAGGTLCRYFHYAGILVWPFLGERQRIIVNASLTSDQCNLQRKKRHRSVVIYHNFMQNIWSLAVNVQSVDCTFSIYDSIANIHDNYYSVEYMMKSQS